MRNYEMRIVAESVASNYVGEIFLPNDSPFSKLSADELNERMPGFGIFEVGFADFFKKREGFFGSEEYSKGNPFIFCFDTFRDYPSANHKPDNPKAFLEEVQSEIIDLSTILDPEWGPQNWRVEENIVGIFPQ